MTATKDICTVIFLYGEERNSWFVFSTICEELPRLRSSTTTLLSWKTVMVYSLIRVCIFWNTWTSNYPRSTWWTFCVLISASMASPLSINMYFCTSCFSLASLPLITMTSSDHCTWEFLLWAPMWPPRSPDDEFLHVNRECGEPFLKFSSPEDMENSINFIALDDNGNIMKLSTLMLGVTFTLFRAVHLLKNRKWGEIWKLNSVKERKGYGTK